MNSVAVVIATYNGAPWIRRCLESLTNGSLVPHIIVVDNASTDNTREIVRADFPEVELIQRRENSGFGIANNAGIRRSIELNCAYTFLLNQDAFVLSDTIQQLANFLSATPEFDIVSPLHCSPDIGSIDKKSAVGYLNRYAKELVSDSLLGHVKSHYRIHGINAAAWLVRTKAFLTAGGFDPIFFMYAEDDDLLARFSYHGLNFALLPSARIVHLRESPSRPAQTFLEKSHSIARRARSRMILDLKNPNYSVFHTLLLCLVNGFLRPIASFMIDRDGTIFAGHLISTVQVLGLIPKIRTHARRCAKTGPHYLDDASLQAIDAYSFNATDRQISARNTKCPLSEERS